MFLVDWIADDGTRRRKDHDDEASAKDHLWRLVRAGITRVEYFEMADPPPPANDHTPTRPRGGFLNLEDQ